MLNNDYNYNNYQQPYQQSQHQKTTPKTTVFKVVIGITILAFVMFIMGMVFASYLIDRRDPVYTTGYNITIHGTTIYNTTFSEGFDNNTELMKYLASVDKEDILTISFTGNLAISGLILSNMTNCVSIDLSNTNIKELNSFNAQTMLAGCFKLETVYLPSQELVDWFNDLQANTWLGVGLSHHVTFKTN